MGMEIIEAGTIPQSSFARRSRVLDCKEYREVIAALATVKPGKALRVVLSAETLELSKNVPFAFKRHLQNHIKDAKLGKLAIAIRKSSDGSPVIYVTNLGTK